MLEYPKETIINSKIPKKKFYEMYDMKRKDKNIFTNDIEKINITHAFQKDNTNIDPYISDEIDYSEIDVIEVTLKRETNNLERIAEIIHRIIPNPILLIFKFKEKFLISVAHKRNSKNDSEKVTLTDMRYTPWMMEDFLGEFDEKLMEKLSIDNLDKGNYYKMYSSMVNAVIITNGSREVNHEVTIPVERIRQINNEIYFIKSEIKKLEAELKRETQFRKEVELNDKIFNLEQEIKKLKDELV